jgi:Zn-finger nucleic acid-binding protein
MFQMTCPWCEVELPLSFADRAVEQTCPECRTAWSFEEDADYWAAELALAA